MNNLRVIATAGLVTAMVIGLSGCSFIPHYQRPDLAVPSRWQNSQSHQGATAAELSWVNFFQDPALRRLISLALENNRDLKVAALNVESARAEYRITGADLLPSVDANLSKTAEHLPGGLYSTQSTGPVTYQEYDANLAVSSWELDFWGRIRSLRDASLEKYLSYQATEQATRLSLVAEVSQAYITLCADNDLQKLAISTANSQQNSLHIAQLKYQAGAVTEQDVLQAVTTVKSAQADVAKYQREKEQAKNALVLLLGTDVPPELVSHATLNKQWIFPDLDAGLSSEVLTRRPDIIAAEHTLKAANANIGAARAAFFPQITLTATGGTSSSGLGQLFSGGSGAWSFIPSVSLPIFNGGKNKAELDVAVISKRIEIADYQKAIQQAFSEVADALAGRETYLKEEQARREDMQANNKYFELATLRYQQGADDYLDVLTAQRSLYSAEQNYIDVLASSLNQKITLYKVLGGGWK